MTAPIRLETPLSDEDVTRLQVGDFVLLSGSIYTARDAAHERLSQLLRQREKVPLELRGAVIYYCGPTPPRPGRPIGSAGPTTASRMDPFTPIILSQGVKGMIGKGRRSAEVREAILRYRCVYFGAVEGAAALLGQRVKAAEVVAFPDLGPEAIYHFVVEDFPLVVINDILGNDLYDIGLRRFARSSAAALPGAEP